MRKKYRPGLCHQYLQAGKKLTGGVNAQIVIPKKEGKEVYYLNNGLIRILQG
jgi:hypothetical protein